MADPYCTACSLDNPPGAKTCVMCSRPLQLPGRPPELPPRRPPAPAAERPSGRIPPDGSEDPTRRFHTGPQQRPATGRQPVPGRRGPPTGGPRPGGPGGKPAPFAALSAEERSALPPPPARGATPSPPAAAAEAPQGPLLGWLSCPPFRPVPVGPKPVVILGRSRECDMILPHSSVSRQHVVVRALGGKAVAEDRSSYGTWLNNKRIVSAELSPGDALTVGPYEVLFKGQREIKREQGEEETKPFAVPASSEAMNGRLEKVALDEVIQQIEFYKKTGTLRVFTDDFDGILVVYEGSPMYAEAEDGAKDAEVVYRMLCMASGNFSFMSKVEAGEMRMAGTSLTALLMEGNRLKDEAQA